MHAVLLFERRLLAGTIAVVLASLALLGCGHQELLPWRPSHYIRAAPINECSGMVRSRTQRGVFWVHNDSGDEPRIFALDREANLLCEVRVLGAGHVDWEDIAADDDGRLYIGDFGNNDNERRDLVIYVLEEPRIPAAPSGQVIEASVSRSIPFRFPEQTQYPDSSRRNFDCEAIFWNDGKLFVLTKHRSDTRTALYEIPLEGKSEREAQKLGETEVGGRVTAADVTPDGRYLVVLSYDFIHVFERPAAGDNYLAGHVHRVLIEGRQCEALGIDGTLVHFANEQREIFSIPFATLLRLERFMPAPPSTVLPRVHVSLDGGDDEWPAGSSLTMRHDIEDGIEPPPQTAPRVRMGWSPDGIAAHVCFGAPQNPSELGGSPAVSVMLGASGPSEPTLREDDRIYQGVFSSGGFVFQPYGADTVRFHTLARGDSVCVEALFPLPGVALEAHTRLTLNILARNLGQDRPSWAWAGSASTQPQGNPLLWGKAELADDR